MGFSGRVTLLLFCSFLLFSAQKGPRSRLSAYPNEKDEKSRKVRKRLILASLNGKKSKKTLFSVFSQTTRSALLPDTFLSFRDTFPVTFSQLFLAGSKRRRPGEPFSQKFRQVRKRVPGGVPLPVYTLGTPLYTAADVMAALQHRAERRKGPVPPRASPRSVLLLA